VYLDVNVCICLHLCAYVSMCAYVPVKTIHEGRARGGSVGQLDESIYLYTYIYVRELEERGVKRE